MTEISAIFIHCSDTPNGRDDRASDIHRWHQALGWDGIGYHHVITRDGRIEPGRPPYWTGAHVRGRNTGTVGICLIGRDEFTPAQHGALESLIHRYRSAHTGASIRGHYEADSGKTCPNIDIPAWLSARGIDRQ